MSAKITEVEQVPRIMRQPVWENQSSGTIFPDNETACLKKSIKRINYHPGSPPVIYSPMSIISIKGTEKCIVYKLRDLVVQTKLPPCHDLVPNFEVLKPY